MRTARKIWALLTSTQRRAALAMLGLMVIGMLLETLGIGLVIPGLSLMMQGDPGARYPSLKALKNALGQPSDVDLIVGGMLVLVTVYTVKTLFLAYLAWYQARFVYGVQAELSQRLFVGYLRQPYSFHLQRNSAQLIRNVVNETTLFTNTGLMAGISVLTELFVLFGVSLLLVIVEPLGALLVLGTLGAAGWAFNRFTQGRILRWGEARQLHEGLRIQHVQQGLGSAKDVKLLGRETEFVEQYQFHNLGSAKVGQWQATLLQLPRLWLEMLAVAGLAILVLVMIAQGKPLEALVPTLGLFAAAGFRLMPSVNRVLNNLQHVRFALPVIEILYAETVLLSAALPTTDHAALPFKVALTLEQISFRYPEGHAKAVCGISLSIPCGASIGFIGGSGAGKSTLVDIILGLLTPDRGIVMIDGINIQSRLRAWQNQLGYVPQSIFLTDDSLRRNVAFGLHNEQIDEAAVLRAIRAAQLEQFVNDLPKGLDTIVGERGVRLSGGQRQRIGIARALYHDPSVLVLDEATSSLDVVTERGVMDAVRALHGKKTIVIVAHRLSTVDCCDRLFRLEGGRVVEEIEAGFGTGQGISAVQHAGST